MLKFFRRLFQSKPRQVEYVGPELPHLQFRVTGVDTVHHRDGSDTFVTLDRGRGPFRISIDQSQIRWFRPGDYVRFSFTPNQRDL